MDEMFRDIINKLRDHAKTNEVKLIVEPDFDHSPIQDAVMVSCSMDICDAKWKFCATIRNNGVILRSMSELRAACASSKSYMHLYMSACHTLWVSDGVGYKDIEVDVGRFKVVSYRHVIDTDGTTCTMVKLDTE